MHIVIEFDKAWTIGWDWLKYVKGVRLGFFAIHLVQMSHIDFCNMLERKSDNLDNTRPKNRYPRSSSLYKRYRSKDDLGKD